MEGKTRFIAAMGGPDAPVGVGSATAQDLADCLESLLGHLTGPGSRVYPPEFNQEKFWTESSEVLEN